jgi:hypothetical protein
VDNRATLIAHALAAGKAFIAHDTSAAVHELLAAAQEHFAGQSGQNKIGGLLSQISGGGGFLGALAQKVQGQPGIAGTLSGVFAQQATQSDDNTGDSQQQEQQSVPQDVKVQGQLGHLEGQLKPEAVQVRTTVADVVQLSGCRNDQTSADAFIGGKPTGALSYAFVKCMTSNAEVSYTQLLLNIRQELQQGKYTQVPQLSTGSITENLDTPFFM